MRNKKILLSLVFILVSVMSVTAKSENNVYTEDKTNIVVTAQQPQFVLKLKSNPTTGYSWFLQDYDSNVILPVKHVFQSPAKGMMGAGGFDIWTFKVKPAGFAVPQRAVIRMIYARAWEKNESEKQVDFRVSTQ